MVVVWLVNLGPSVESPGEESARQLPAAQPALAAHGEKRVPMTRLRKRVAERLLEANSTAMLTKFAINMTIMDLRKQYGG